MFHYVLAFAWGFVNHEKSAVFNLTNAKQVHTYIDITPTAAIVKFLRCRIMTQQNK